MGKKAFDIFRLHMRLGYVAALNLITVPFWGFAIADLARYDLDIRPALALAVALSTTSAHDITEALSTLSIFMVFLPCLVATFRAISIQGPSTTGLILGKQNTWINAVYLINCTLLVFASKLCTAMERLKGNAMSNGELHNSFNSLLKNFLLHGSQASKLFVGLLLPIMAPVVLSFFLSERLDLGKSNETAFSRYIKRAKLADLKSEFYPDHGRHVLNLNGGSIAPGIRAIRRKALKLLDEYQDSVPGSKNSRKFLEGYWSKVRQQLLSFFQDGNDLTDAEILLFESTTRALAASIVGYPPSRKLFISPWEHPSEIAMAKELEAAEIVELHYTAPWPGMFEEPTQKACKKFAGLVREEIQRGSTKTTNIIVVSEVCWATGIPVPVKKLRDMILSDGLRMNIKFIIDGAHSVGNIKNPDCQPADVMLFSGHKWLLCPHPCGIAIIRDTANCNASRYDSWTCKSLPSSTGDPGTVLGLHAALEVGANARDSVFRARSQELRKRFLEMVENHYLIVGQRDNHNKASQLLSIRPRDSMTWIDNPDAIEDTLVRKGVSVLPIKMNQENDRDKRFWLRVTFPYFLDFADVERAAKLLRQLVKSKHH